MIRLRSILFQTLLLCSIAWPVAAATTAYQGWQHSGAFYILTTPEGANLPAAAVEKDFPLLVRLDKDWFDFRQAKAHGEDLRFATSSGTPLAYEIDDWNPAGGTACIWVRIPSIKGDARQEVKMFWGNADAPSALNGKAVFNESNGYLCVMHMNGPVRDSLGTLKPKDLRTTSAPGRIGQSRHFEPGKGIDCGDDITAFPTGSDPHTTEVWFRDQKLGERIVCWGNDKPHAMVQIIARKPAAVLADCYDGAASIRGTSEFALGEWVNAVHTYDRGDSRLYVNGRLDGVASSNKPTLNFESPVRMDIGGWRRYGFKGDIDEVRVSNVARSADWVKLQYENQKALQTAVGPLVQPGADLSASAKKIDLLEGKSATVTAKAGGAQKVSWSLIAGGKETVAAVDRFSFTFDAGRVSGDQSLVLRFKAVYADGVKTIDIPIHIAEDIPDPIFTLKAPAKWDGRKMIEVVPQLANRSAMQAKGVGNVKIDWTISGMAVTKETSPDKLVLLRAEKSGPMTVTATASNGGTPTTQSVQIAVTAPSKDAWVERTPEKDEKPVDNQFFARDDKNEGTLYYNGTLAVPAGATAAEADSVFLKLYADNKLIGTQNQKLGADRAYAFSAKLKPGLINYKVEFGSKNGNAETVLRTVENLVCGDAYIIQGQSNAVAYNYDDNKTDPLIHYSSNWIRTFGGNGEAEQPTKGGWGNAVMQRLTPTALDRVYYVGAWGLVMARKLVEDEKIPICILNGAFGGTRIDEHLPDPTDRYGTTNRAHSIYRNLLRRAVAAKLTHGIRGVLWHQGEADQGIDGPDNCYDSEKYEQYFIDLSAAWKQDYPNIQDYYVYQIWPNACGQGGTWHSDKLRDIQRRLPRLYSNLSVMPTLGFPSGGCHFELADYEKMGLSMAPLLERDSDGRVFDRPITAPDLQRACYTSDKKNKIALEFDQPVAWTDALLKEFYLDRQKADFVAGTASGNVLTLKLAAPADAKTITYLIDKKWDQKTVLYGQNGIAALTFSDVPLAAANPAGKQ